MPNQQTNRQTTEQDRARSAWEAVDSLSNLGFRKEYGSQARGLPAMIQTNGLGQTLAFLKAKAKNEDNAYRRLYEHLSQWGFARLTGSSEKKKPTGAFAPQGQVARATDDLLEWLVYHDSSVYRRATTEAMAYAHWLRRFAEAKGWGEEGGGNS